MSKTSQTSKTAQQLDRRSFLQVTALAGLVDIGYVKATGTSVIFNLPKSATKPEVSFEWKIPKWSNTIERDRARPKMPSGAALPRRCAACFPITW